MRHFSFLTPQETAALFAVAPQDFSPEAPRQDLAVGLGATLYSPGTRPQLADDAVRAASLGATSQVWCLEDSVPHAQVAAALDNVTRNLKELAGDHRAPMLFVRVRTPEHVRAVVDGAGEAATALRGFVLPKFAPDEVGRGYLTALEEASQAAGHRFYAQPVLEHPELAWRETRIDHLSRVRDLLDARRDGVLAVRVGGTDLCGLFGLRRDRDTTIWDVAVVRDVLADVVNVFTRGGDYVVTGPVWEHFQGLDRLFRPQLRATPFEVRDRMPLRQKLLRDHADELLREVLLDRANGFHGKTVIHPTHVNVVNALQAVSPEEHDDARTVLAVRGRGGAIRSASGNKMNEVGPHELWAEQLVKRATIYGVLARPDGVIELLERGRAVAESLYPTR